MARYKGHEGDVTIGGTSIGERISFSIELTANTADASTMGYGWTDIEGLQNSAQGELEVFWDPADAQQAAMTVGATITATFYPGGYTTGLQSITGDWLVERVGISTNVGDLVKTTFTIRNKSIITVATIA